MNRQIRTYLHDLFRAMSGKGIVLENMDKKGNIKDMDKLRKELKNYGFKLRKNEKSNNNPR